MRICVVGSGAIGGYMGTRLSVSGQEVTFIDTGKQLEAIQKKGLRLKMCDGTEYAARGILATDNFDEAGTQDVIILAVKAHHIHQVAPKMPALFKPDTSVVTVQNGIPWWYFYSHDGKFKGRRLKCFDPTGVIEANIPADRIIGCVAYPAAILSEPGVVRHVEGDRFPIGELNGIESHRCKILFQALVDAGFRSRIISDIRAEIWLKAWGTLSFNPISALTHATMVDICQFPETRELARKMMTEAQEVAEKLGIQFRHTIERRLSGAEAVGAHKTSMLQDIEAGRTLEIDALVGAVIELARLTDTPVPVIDAVYSCTKLLNKTYSDAKSRVEMTRND